MLQENVLKEKRDLSKPESFSYSKLLEDARSLSPYLVSLRRHFHKHPELSGNEIHTAKRIVEELEKIGGYNIRRDIGGHGVSAEISGNKKDDFILLRADMDALPINEETGLPYSSEYPGIMHACGHDHHITILLGAAMLIYRYAYKLNRSVRLVFQPSEEQSPIGGSRKMIDSGIMYNVSGVFGLHVWPGLKAGVIGVREGDMMASSDKFNIRFKGETSHAAMPHKGKDALIAGCYFVSQAQSIISRCLDPMNPAVINIGRIESGTRYNVIPSECLIEGTVRTYDKESRDIIEKKIYSLYQGILSIFSLEGEISYERGYDAVKNTKKGKGYVEKTALKLFGQDSVIEAKYPAMTSEDFSFYLNLSEGAYFWLGTDEEGEEIYPLHSSHYKGNESVLWKGAALMAELALDNFE